MEAEVIPHPRGDVSLDKEHFDLVEVCSAAVPLMSTRQTSRKTETSLK